LFFLIEAKILECLDFDLDIETPIPYLQHFQKYKEKAKYLAL